MAILRLMPSWLLLWMLVLSSIHGETRAATPAKEYQVKAVFLFNFALFTQWPSSAFSGADAPLVIGVAGKDPFGSFLDQVVAGERVNGRRLVVRRYAHAVEAADCHILFVGRSESERALVDLKALRGRSVPTVSDIEGFAVRGGNVELRTTRGRIRLRINVDAVRDAGLTLSSKLLRPAEIVGGGP